MPAVEARVVPVFGIANGLAVERLVVGVLEHDILQALKFGHGAVANDLNLGLVRNGLQVRVQNRALRVNGLAVSIAGTCRVEQSCQLELRAWR